jgi:hypothetical protein
VAIGTAWSGYEASRWGGFQSEFYGNAAKLRIQAQGILLKGGQQAHTLTRFIIRIPRDTHCPLSVRELVPKTGQNEPNTLGELRSTLLGLVGWGCVVLRAESPC